MIRVATIGTNFITDDFLEAMTAYPEISYQMAYSRDEAKAKAYGEKHGAKTWCSDIAELSANLEVDAVYIASPNSLHFEQARALIAGGKHILCEKTITSNKKELETLIALAKTKKVVLLEAMRSAFSPGFALIKAHLPELGTLRRATLQFGKYSSRYDKFKKGIIENAFNPKFSNGALMDIGVYCVHPLVRLFGLPEKVMADTIFLENHIDGAGTILAHYEGMMAELLYSKICDNYLPSQIQGEEGTMVIDSITNPSEITLYLRSGLKKTLALEPMDNNMGFEIGTWLELIKNKNIDHPHLQASLMALEVMDRVRDQLGIVFPAD